MIHNLTEEFDKIYKKLSKPSFLDMSSIGNEVPFYISPYDPSRHYAVEEQIDLLTQRLTENGISTCTIHLYQLCMSLLERKGALDLIARKEPELDPDDLLDALRMLLQIDDVVAEIGRQISDSEPQITLVRQVGQVFPYLRSHSLLNNLQPYAKSCPTVFFFPGLYDNIQLKLFSLLENDNYYRALNLASIPV